MKHRVIKAESGQYLVDIKGEFVKIKARSKLKKDSVIVGDFVGIEDAKGELVITSVEKRRNRLIRPSIANIDQIIVIVAPFPEIDYLLIDKLIINAERQDIDVILCVNKSDLSEEIIHTIEREYKAAVKSIIQTSAIKSEVEMLIPLLEGKLTCLCGQSAVGKSTLINALLGDNQQRTGELSKRIARGKNTTTASEIFPLCGGYLVDTPGFSALDIFDIELGEICHYYPEFDDFRAGCKFSTCTHTSEPDCAVKNAAACGMISENRLARYQTIYAETKNYLDRNPNQKTKTF